MGRDVLSCELTEPPPIVTPSKQSPCTREALLSAFSDNGLFFLEKVSSEPCQRKRTHSRSRTSIFRRRFYPDINDTQWNDWHWQFANRLRTLEQLDRVFKLTSEERAAFEGEMHSLPVGITPYYASIVDPEDTAHPLRKTVVPLVYERLKAAGEAEDPLDENAMMPVPGLVHRYPDRVLFLVSTVCSAYCRYCTRSRLVGEAGHHQTMSRERWEKCLDYIESHPEIRDVLLSGGDPLVLPDEALQWLLVRLRRIPHVEMIRIGSKAPIVMPQRVTPALTNLLRRYHPLWMSIHVTHPDEITPESSRALNRLADAGIPLGSQTVLLAGVNDTTTTMKRLVHELVKNRVRPYYLYQCDPIVGSSHFRTPVEKGVEIIRSLRGHTSGYAVPTFVIDAPGGGGKVPVSPDYVKGRAGSELMLTNYEGKTFSYPDIKSLD